jgi:hypothetical protein
LSVAAAKVQSFKVNNRNQVVVKTDTKFDFKFDYVISTLPIANLQRNLDTLFPASYWPPAKRAALMQFRMATYTKAGTLLIAGQ